MPLSFILGCELTESHRTSPWVGSLLLPVYVAGVSGLTLSLQAIVDTLSKNGRSELEGAPASVQSRTLGRPRFRQILDNLGGGTIFAYKLVQLLSILCLFGISAAQLALQSAASVASHDVFGTIEIVQITQCALYVSHRDTDTCRVASPE